MPTTWPEKLIVRALTVADAQRIATWHYEGQWRIYDPRPDDGLMSDNPDYLAVAGSGGGPLVGFCCSGAEARVPGLALQDGVLDVGVGMDPAWVGQGHGRSFVGAVVEHYRSVNRARRMRAVVHEWNERSFRVFRALGFAEVGEHRCEQAGQLVTYKVLVTG